MLANSCFIPRRDPTPLLQRMRENREEVNAILVQVWLTGVVAGANRRAGSNKPGWKIATLFLCNFLLFIFPSVLSQVA